MSDMNILLSTSPNYFERSFEDGLKERKLILNDEICTSVVEKFILPILEWNKEDEGIPVEDRKKITLYLNTPGGAINDGFVLCNIIENSQTPIEIIVLGTCASMGLYICVSASKWGMRKAYPFSTFLMHSGSMFVGGNSNAVTSTVNYYNELEKDIAKFVYKHTKITPAYYKKRQKDEYYFSSKEAKKISVIDEIIGEEE